MVEQSANAKLIPLMEVFGPTIQGEGAVIGLQTYFLRFGLCDSRCRMCDSMHAVDPRSVKQNAKWLSQVEIVNALYAIYKEGSTDWVTFSGGNPCIHDLSELTSILFHNQWRIAVETQGTIWQDWLEIVDTLTISPKGPGMGEETDFDKLDNFVEMACNHGRGSQYANFKLVAFDQRDLEFAKLVWERYRSAQFPFYLSLGNPYPPGQDVGITDTTLQSELVNRYKQLWEDIQSDSILSKMRFLPQWHVFVWGNARGK